jgi:hypothetical protein
MKSSSEIPNLFREVVAPFAKTHVNSDAVGEFVRSLWEICHPHLGLTQERIKIKKRLRAKPTISRIKKVERKSKALVELLNYLDKSLAVDYLLTTKLRDHREAISDVILTAKETIGATLLPDLQKRTVELQDRIRDEKDNRGSIDPLLAPLTGQIWSVIVKFAPQAKPGSKSKPAPAGKLVHELLGYLKISISESRVVDHIVGFVQTAQSTRNAD